MSGSNSRSAEKSKDLYTSSSWKDSMTRTKTDQKLSELREQHNFKNDMRAHYLGPMMDIDSVSKKKKNHHAKHLRNHIPL